MGATVAPEKPKAKRKAPLTSRERRLLEVLPEAETLEKALLSAGFSESTAKKQAGRTIQRLVGKGRENGLLQEFDKAGINHELLTKKHLEGLESYKVISAKIVEKGAGAADNDFIEIPDFQTRHKYLDTIHKLRQDFPNEKVEHSGSVAHTVEIVNYGDKEK